MWSKNAGPTIPPSLILVTDAWFAAANAEAYRFHDLHERFVDVDEHGQLRPGYALVASCPMGAWHYCLQTLIPQKVSGQVEPCDVGLFDPGDREVDAPPRA